MKINDIIVLDDEQRYVLLEEVNYENEKYFLANPVNIRERLDENKLLILKEINEEDGTYVETVVDQDLIIKLSQIIAEKQASQE